MKKLETLTFKKFCMTIGNLPSSYIDSLSYYECLLWLIKYLKDEVIPTVNNNSEAVQELQNLFTQLQEFIQNYFNDLDVQEEINNKLDVMAEDGTLASIINEDLFSTMNINITNNTNAITLLQNKQNQTDSDISNINNINLEQSIDIGELQQAQSNNVQKNEANSITLDMLTSEVRSAMTGGSTPIVGTNSIGTKELIDGGITVYKLNENLKSLYSLSYTQVEKPQVFAGFYQKSGGNLAYYTNDTLQCYTINLTKGVIYRFSGYNYSASKGIFIGTDIGSPVIAESTNGTELDNETTTITPDIYSTDFIFECTEDGLKAYITEFNDSAASGYVTLQNKAGGLFTLSGIEIFSKELPRNNLVEVNPYVTLNNSFLQFGVNPYYIRTANGYSLSCYKFQKGHKYKVTGTQQYLIAGFILYDNQFYDIYESSTENHATISSYEYEFTATSDCYGAVTTGLGLTATVKEYTIGLEGEEYSRLNGLKIIYDGDSITESRTTEGTAYNGGAYPKIISDLTNSTYVNYAKGGATLASASGGYRIVNDITNMDANADVIIFSGGINDYWQNIPLGTYSESDYTGSVDITTVSGALEKIFRDSINKWCGKPILFVITHKIYGTAFTDNSAGYSFEDLHDRIVAICNKYSIPYYDCYKDGGLNSYLSIMNTTYMTAGSSGNPDYTHPNEAAYVRYYVPQVIDLINKNLKYNN